MKTTLELPDGLMRRVKLRAVHRNCKLKDEIAQLLEAGMVERRPVRAGILSAPDLHGRDVVRCRGGLTARS